MPEDTKDSGYFSGAVGAGLVLVLVPCAALYMGVKWLADLPTVGLPILAIFGIMILFGSLALIASLFSGLGLDDKTQPLGLPDGSIRAAIALALIVLFAIISIMLYQSLASPYQISGVTEAAREKMAQDLGNKVIAIVPVCPWPTPACSPEPAGAAPDKSPAPASAPAPCTYTFHVLQPQGKDAGDLAKQLLTLIGTLVASVTSFYFASRGNETFQQQLLDAINGKPVTRTNPSGGGGGGNGDGGNEGGDVGNSAGGKDEGGAAPNGVSSKQASASGDGDEGEGCGLAPATPTLDQDLPAASGGVHQS